MVESAQKTTDEAKGLYDSVKILLFGDPNAPKIEPVFTGKWSLY